MVDDSLIMARTISDILQKDRNITVIDTAINGEEAIIKANKLRPDVITMDLNMPVVDGVSATRRIVSRYGIPIVILSAYSEQKKDTINVIRTLLDGAIEIVQKPAGEISLDLNKITAELISKVKIASQSTKMLSSIFTDNSQHSISDIDDSSIENVSVIENKNNAPDFISVKPRRISIILIVASTGGPSAITELLEQLSDRIKVPILIVIHMAQWMLVGFSETLAETCPSRNVKIAESEVIRDNTIYIAPDDRHSEIERTRDGIKIKFSDGPRVHGCRPSGDVLLNSVPTNNASKAVGIVLSGMGSDGAKGLKKMRDEGAVTIAQSEDSSIIYGMSRKAVELGAAEYVLSPKNIAKLLEKMII